MQVSFVNLADESRDNEGDLMEEVVFSWWGTSSKDQLSLNVESAEEMKALKLGDVCLSRYRLEGTPMIEF